ncbi:SUKH-3 domain-containing protein [Lysinibacillus sp. A4]|uniref:SUKH-3 domain-containing protein n=1 Tax=Lysinibacillus TaxID=400634 RepID=UPI002175D3E3|nr:MULTISPECIES: SUKH-3 domain-containing protein [Lysinibacillus]MCS5504102.1 SUKH-3 domain-containing protein [Lysinibacillus sp. A4]MEA0566267.1 SUKH-3 domain-containing protein [Lysinibacillus irui]WGT37908.1 SUKH-3 domain-containing protein [Lysinibacillus sp. 1 U-2021]
MERLSIKTEKVLKQSGWNPNRKIDINSQVKYLENKGYVVFDCVKEALEQFGELKCIYENDGKSESFVIEPKEGLGDLDRRHYKRYEVIIGNDLVVIGTAFRDNAVLYMSKQGEVYAVLDDYYIWKVGCGIYEALNNLCEGRELKVIHEEHLKN